MAVKVYVLLVVLMFAGVVLPIAHAQLGSPSLVTVISGTVPCNVGNNISLSTPNNVFPNATVQLRCSGNVVASTTTNSNGGFSIVIPSLLISLEDLINCNIVVTTTLFSCNASLPTDGNLVSPLTFVNTIVGIARLAAVSFTFVRGLIG
ncbi:hypothetical protein LUZ63_007868 [Rhynchospora breviuscula]|uniref:Phylloplanin-like n=1 Tax=Rhynchospora breviuscula TaxID=2022672 RepID=A0A9Q0HUZ4_9POAL|nr:hypothetical protein LUZ63_007868 [Rhynchospora breviuscula]